MAESFESYRSWPSEAIFIVPLSNTAALPRLSVPTLVVVQVGIMTRDLICGEKEEEVRW
eukprot:CAMPEP_0198224282 /NCGR_PEP_ID=MMETSP1445-20131203/96255_1 /TAXON_ID=36898 /ORGANISM="Pyramimonas sp., Strain CCMP2087" /LENGTH=58 /DNA_ID=CAMNT_0043903401 /DNA_START=62 /DNA_END=238 /DNA_ORIENTATION=-